MVIKDRLHAGLQVAQREAVVDAHCGPLRVARNCLVCRILVDQCPDDRRSDHGAGRHVRNRGYRVGVIGNLTRRSGDGSQISLCK